MNANITDIETVEVRGIHTTPDHDPYHRGQNIPTVCTLGIDPEERVVWVGCEYGQGIIEADVWLGRDIAVTLDSADEGESPRTPDGDALETYLRGEEGQRLLGIVCDEYAIEWNGNNYVGGHTAESRAALDALLADIAKLPHTTYHLWQTNDWFGNAADNEITAETTDEEIAAMAAYGDDAEFEGGVVVLSDDAGDYLTGLRDELRADEVDEEE